MRTGTTRTEIRPGGIMYDEDACRARRLRLESMSTDSKVMLCMFPLNLMQMLLEAKFRNFGLPFSQLAQLRIHSPIAQPPVSGRSL